MSEKPYLEILYLLNFINSDTYFSGSFPGTKYIFRDVFWDVKDGAIDRFEVSRLVLETFEKIDFALTKKGGHFSRLEKGHLKF